jgi:hypothetical protein
LAQWKIRVTIDYPSLSLCRDWSCHGKEMISKIIVEAKSTWLRW